MKVYLLEVNTDEASEVARAVILDLYKMNKAAVNAMKGRKLTKWEKMIRRENKQTMRHLRETYNYLSVPDEHI